MKKNESNEVVSLNPLTATGIEKMLLVIRDKQVLLDRDLATLYGVETKALNQAVKRNIERFPERNCFRLDSNEKNELVTNCDRFITLKHSSVMPTAFTEQGVAMLATVLRSETAIRVSLQIMDAFVAMRHFMMQNGGFVNRLSNVEAKIIDQDERILAQDKKMLEHDQKIDELFEAMDRGELQSKGLFYNNQVFDAYVFVCGLIRQAKKRIVLVDRYVDEKTLAMMQKRKKGVAVTIYTYDKSKVFEIDLSVYNAQYANCPIEILPSYGMHDRFLFIDETAYHFGASLKDLGKNTFFFSQEDFTLGEVLRKSNEIAERIALENKEASCS